MSKTADIVALAGLVMASNQERLEATRKVGAGLWIRRRDGHLIGAMYSGSRKFTRSQKKGRGASDKGSHLHAGYMKRERKRRHRARVARAESRLGSRIIADLQLAFRAECGAS